MYLMNRFSVYCICCGRACFGILPLAGTLVVLLQIAITTIAWADETKGHQEVTIDLTELGLEELMEIEIAVVQGASKYEQKVTEAPSSVSIVTADEIKKYGYRTLADILRSIRGIYTTYDRNYHYLGVRGFNRPGDYNTRILLLVDGHRVNDNIYDTSAIGTDFLLDVDLIDRVEVIRGPSSSLYGSNAFLGMINVITKQGRDFKGPEISGGIASYDAYKGRLSYGNRFQNGLEMLVSGSIYDSEGQDLYFPEFDDPATNNGRAEGVDNDQYHSFFLKLSLHDLTLHGGCIYREKGLPTAAWETEFNDSHNTSIDRRDYLELKYEHTFDRQLDVMARLYYDNYKFEGDYVYDYSEEDDPFIVINSDAQQGQWWGGELQLTKKMFQRHKLVWGAEYEDNFRQDQRNYDRDPFYQYFEDKRDSVNWAVYIQDEFAMLDDLTLNFGMRHDDYETFGGTTNPRLCLIYDFSEKSTVKLLYGEAFRAPNAYELYYHDGEDIQKANPELEPETIKTYELAWEQYFGKHFRTTAAGYYYKIEDLISQQIDPADDLLVFNNIEKIEAKGIEVELDGKWDSGLEGRISYAFQEAENEGTGKLLTNSPRHITKFNLIVPLIKNKIFVGTEFQYVSDRKTLTDEYADDFFVANLTLSGRNLLKGLEVSANVYNVFDEEYGDPGSGEHLQDVIEQDGRTFRVQVTYRF